MCRKKIKLIFYSGKCNTLPDLRGKIIDLSCIRSTNDSSGQSQSYPNQFPSPGDGDMRAYLPL